LRGCLRGLALVPKIPSSAVEAAGQYGEFRGALFADWEPGKRSMLISTRFAATPQLRVEIADPESRLGVHILYRTPGESLRRGESNLLTFPTPATKQQDAGDGNGSFRNDDGEVRAVGMEFQRNR
jgi:hypothetical protein